MAFRKGSSDGSAKVLDLLDDVESALAEAGWTDLGVWEGGGYGYHGWRSDESNSGVIDFVVVLRVPLSGDGQLNLFAGENWRDSDGHLQRPVFHYGSEEAMNTSNTDNGTSPFHNRRLWLPRDGGDFTMAAPIGSYDLGNPWWWPLDEGAAGAVTTCQVRVADDVFTQWMVLAKGDHLVVSTYRWNGGTRDLISAFAVDSFAPWVPTGAHVGMAAWWNDAGFAGAVNRPAVHPEYEQFVSQDYSHDLDTDNYSRYVAFQQWTRLHVASDLTATGSHGEVGAEAWYERVVIGAGGVFAQPIPLSNSMRGAFLENPETGERQAFIGTGVGNPYNRPMTNVFIAFLPGLRLLNTRDSVVNMGDEVEGHGGQRFVYAGLTSTLNSGQLWMVK